MIDDTTADEIRASNAHTRRANERARQAGIPPVFFRGRRVWSEARVARPLECPGFGRLAAVENVPTGPPMELTCPVCGGLVYADTLACSAGCVDLDGL